MKILGRTQPLSHYPIHKCLNVIKCLGFDGVEICLENSDLNPETLTVDLIQSVVDQVHALSLNPYSVSYHKDYVYDEHCFELTKRAIELTPVLGTDVFVFSGTQKRTDDQEEWARMVARTRELVELASAYGVILAQEFEPGFIVGSTAELMCLFDALPSPYLAANLDLGHVFLCDPDPLAAIAQVGPKIVHCHVENMRAGIHDHLLPQEGDMDMKAYLQALAETKFVQSGTGCGGLALDLYKYDYEAVAPGAIAYLRTLLEDVSSSSGEVN